MARSKHVVIKIACSPGSVEEWHGGMERRRGWAKMRERAVVGMVKQGQSQKGTTRGLRLSETPGLRLGSSLWWHFGAEGAEDAALTASAWA